MSSIKIHLEHVRKTNNSLVRQINGLDNIGGRLISLNNSIDPRIKNRQQIEARITKAVRKGNKIEHELWAIKEERTGREKTSA